MKTDPTTDAPSNHHCSDASELQAKYDRLLEYNELLTRKISKQQSVIDVGLFGAPAFALLLFGFGYSKGFQNGRKPRTIKDRLVEWLFSE